MKTLFLSVLYSLLSVSLAAASPFNDGFARKEASVYLENYAELRFDAGFEKIDGMKGKYCLRIRCENQKDAKIVPAPIKPGDKYEIAFRCEFLGGETIESNPTLRQTTQPGWKFGYKYLPTFSLIFLDESKKALRGGFTIGMPYGKWHSFRRWFFAPPHAAFVQCVFNSGINNGRLYIDDLKFKHLSSDRRKISFVFDGKIGDCPPSGMAPNNQAKIVSWNGTGCCYSGYGVPTDLFPLAGDAEYKLTFTGEALKAYHAVFIYFFDEKLKRIKRQLLKDPVKSPIPIKTPKNTRWAYFLIYSHLLSEIKIERMR